MENKETLLPLPTFGGLLWTEVEPDEQDVDAIDRRRAERDGWEGHMWWDGK